MGRFDAESRILFNTMQYTNSLATVSNTKNTIHYLKM